MINGRWGPTWSTRPASTLKTRGKRAPGLPLPRKRLVEEREHLLRGEISSAASYLYCQPLEPINSCRRGLTLDVSGGRSLACANAWIQPLRALVEKEDLDALAERKTEVECWLDRAKPEH
jgi:hypothetical protein